MSIGSTCIKMYIYKTGTFQNFNFKMHFQAMYIIIDCSISSADRERLSGDMVMKEPGIMIISEIS